MEVAASKWANNRNIMGMKAKSIIGLLSTEPTGYDTLIYRTVPLHNSHSNWRSFQLKYILAEKRCLVLLATLYQVVGLMETCVKQVIVDGPYSKYTTHSFHFPGDSNHVNPPHYHSNCGDI